MADDENVTVDGRPISSLRVVDLKKECEKRSLSKSGSKSQLVERLKSHLLLEKLQQPSDSDYSSDPGLKAEEEGGVQNEFIRQYLERQKLLLEAAGDTGDPNKSAEDTQESETSVSEEYSPAKGQLTGQDKTAAVEENLVKTNLKQYPEPDSSNKLSEETAVHIEEADTGKDLADNIPDELRTESKTVVSDNQAGDINSTEKSQEPEVTVEQSGDKANQIEHINTESDIKETEPQYSEETDTSEEMGRSKRKSDKHTEDKVEKVDKKDKESGRHSQRRSENLKEEEKHLENGNKIDDKQKSVKSQGDLEANVAKKIDAVGVKEGTETKANSIKTNGSEEVAMEPDNVNNSAESVGKQRKRSGPADIEKAEKIEKEKREASDEESRGRKGSQSGGRMSGRRKSDEKMDTEVTGSKDKLSEQKHAENKRQSGRRSRKQSSSSSSRSRSRSPSPKQKSKGKKSRSSSSDSSRSRSPPVKSKSAAMSQRQAQRPPSRSSSSSRSRSRSPTPKRVKMKDRSDSESSRSRSRTPSPQRPTAKVSKTGRSSRSSSRSRSRSPVPEKMSADSTDEPPIDHKEKSFYTEEEESPLPVKVKSRATLEVAEKKVEEPVKSGLTEEKDVKEEGELIQTEVAQGEVTQESEKPVIPVKQSKKISLNRGKSSDVSKPGEGEGEKAEEGEKPAKKRKWGSKSTTSLQNKPKKVSSVPISTDSLKGLIPDLKPSLKLAEPVLEEMDYEDEEEIIPSMSEQQQLPPKEDTRDVKIQRTVVQDVKDNPDSPTSSDAEDSGEREENKVKDEEMDEPSVKKERMMTDKERETVTKTITITRKEKPEVKIVRQVSHKPVIPLIKPDEPEAARRSPSPARNPVGRIVHVRNLVRPFTIGQLKELLKRTGPFAEESFWIDKIKSHCFVTYDNEEDAVKTRQALHNTRWPQSNPKTLSVDFGTEEQVEFHKKEEMPKPVFPKKDRATLRKEKEAKQEQERLEREKEIEKRRMEREKRMKEREEREQKNKPKPVREWDREKLEKGDWDRTQVRSRSRSPKARRRSPGSESPVRERRRSREKREKKEKPAEEPPAKLLDDLFRKTKTTPCIYWLPLTEAQAAERAKARKNRIEERLKNLASTELTDESPTKENRRASPQREERNKSRGSPPRRRPRTSDERPGRTSDERSRERSRQRAEQRRDSRSRSGRRR